MCSANVSWPVNGDASVSYYGTKAKTFLSDVRQPEVAPLMLGYLTGLRFSISSGIRFQILLQWNLDSGFLELNSGFQSHARFRIPKEEKITLIPES